MDSKKKIVKVGAVTLVLIVIILILMVILTISGEIQKKQINFSMNNNVQNSIANPDQKENEVTIKNEIQNTITGKIIKVKTTDEKELPVPPTFKYLEGEYATGAVIEDNKKNQFVWIPIDENNEYSRWMFESKITKEELDKLNLNDINSYNYDFDKSVKKYGGFYVARYEAGKENNNDIPVSKANVLPWTKIVWSVAKDLATSMYQENDYFETDLINSYAWDSICNWLENSGIDINDSTIYGNYQNNSEGLNRIVETGSYENWKVNNIYDMAGNAWEYTTEEYGDHEKYHIGRGGGYWNEGNLYPISTRGTSDDNADLNIGFRVVMYLK